jgi:TonB family protein
MRGVLRRVLLLTMFLFACAPPAPKPEPVAPPPEPVASKPAEEKVIGTVRVTASALNVRSEPSTDADVIAQVKKGEALSVLVSLDAWVKVRLGSGEVGWVAARFVSNGKVAQKKTKSKGCQPDSDFAFVETPMLAFSDSGAHGVVVVDANVNVSGNVTRTKVLSNSTGDDALAFLAEREIKAAKFSPPIRNCAPREFVFTYRRTF